MARTLSAPVPAFAGALRGHMMAAWLLANVGIALVMFQSEVAATLHAVAVLGVGMWWAYDRQLDRVLYVAAYIAGAEVLWRMCDANVNWEFGKYSLIALIAVGLSRSHRLRGPAVMLFYFILLIPSAWLTGDQNEWSVARRVISFNLSGPLALMMCTWLCSHLTLTPTRVRILILALLAPILGIAANAIFHTFSLPEIEFGGGSDSGTSGGFGPNQVSSVLGLGALVAFLYMVIKRATTLQKTIVLTVALICIVQSGLTFSRSGIAMALGGATIASLFLLRDARARVSLALITALLFLFVRFIMIPVLDDFTKGAFTERFTDASATHRDKIAWSDVELFLEYPALGVGPGQASIYRAETSTTRVAAHTEFTRMLAEHGTFGLLSMGLLLFAAYRNFRRSKNPKARAFVAAMLTWAFLFFLVNGFRLAAPALAFGLTFATIMPLMARRPPPIRLQRQPGDGPIDPGRANDRVRNRTVSHP